MSRAVLSGNGEARQGPDAALREDHVAVPLRIRNAALVIEHRYKFPGRIEDVGQLLSDPPAIFASTAVIVIAAANPVEGARIQDVPPLIEQRAIETAIHRDFAVAVKFAPHNFQIARSCARSTDALDGRLFYQVRRGRVR